MKSTFFSGVENSFPNPVLRNFLQKYYQILLHQKYPKKESKLMLVGPPDSGKTSWFCPFEGKKIPIYVHLDLKTYVIKVSKVKIFYLSIQYRHHTFHVY